MHRTKEKPGAGDGVEDKNIAVGSKLAVDLSLNEVSALVVIQEKTKLQH